MRILQVSIERMGEKLQVGTIAGNDHRDACFCYAPAYLALPEAVPVSVSLPLGEEPFSPEQTRIFFDGLLPEGFTRRSVAQWVHADENDYISILSVLGEECLGAIQVREEGREQTQPGYEKLSKTQVRQLATEGASRSTEIITKTHLSLAGASGKVGLYYEKARDRWYLPIGDAPSTHIVKQSHVRLSDIVLNEQLCIQTAAALGLDVPGSFIVNTGEGGDADVLFATRRYDRVFPEAEEGRETEGEAGHKVGSVSCVVDGLPAPWRLHQEDFGQALGVGASLKYEQPGQQYLAKIFALLRQVSSDPIADQLKLWDTLVFHYFIGNTDGHIKNFSLLYSPNLKTIRLAPSYDILSTVVYDSSTRQMALAIGGELEIDALTRAHFEAAAGEAGLGKRLAMQHYDALRESFKDALEDSAGRLAEAGFANAQVMKKKILKHFKGTGK